MIRAVAINGFSSNSDPNEHQVSLTVRCQEEDSIAVIKILNDTIVKLHEYDPALDMDNLILLKDTKNIQPLVAPSKPGEQPN